MFVDTAQLSNQFILRDLTLTNQSLTMPNLPTTPYDFDNLKLLAQTLEYLQANIGPFQILSAYRTKELQDKLTAEGEPTGSGVKSFHEVGRGVDIYPTTMSIDEYFGRILANPDLKDQFAEIAIKPSQNALHLAINVPGDVRTPKVTGLNPLGVYARLSVDEITAYIAPFMDSVEDAYDYAAAELVSINFTPMIVTAVAALGGGILLLLARGKQTASRKA